MNLYKVMFKHFSQNDSEIGILTYLVAKSDEEVYEWLKSDPKLQNETYIYTAYRYRENDRKTYKMYDDDYNVIGEESYKDKIIRLNGDMFDEDADLSDLYYGKTLYGWQLVKEDVKADVIHLIKEYGINIEQVEK